MTFARYRMLLWLYVGLLALECISGFSQGYREGLQAAQLGGARPELLGNPWISGVLLFCLAAAFLVALVGLFGFKRWSRPLSLTVTVAGILFGNSLISPSPSSGLENVLSEASATLWGAILAVAYFSGISARFRR